MTYLNLLLVILATAGMLFLAMCYPVQAADWAYAPDRSDPPAFGLIWEVTNDPAPDSYQIWVNVDDEPRTILKAVAGECWLTDRGCEVSWGEGEAVFWVIPNLGDQRSFSEPSDPIRLWPDVTGNDNKVGFTDFVAALFGPMDLGAVMHLYGAELTAEGRYVKP